MPKSMLGFGLALVILPFAACGKPEGSQAQTSPSPTTQTPTVIVTTVRSLELNRQIRLPGELQAWQDTAIYAKVQGFVEEINVDRGSVVKRGQLLARLRAPELDTQRGEAEARVRAADSSGRLAPGMFPEVIWPTRRQGPSLFVPPTAIAVTTERVFVIRIRDGAVEWVDVKRGASMNHQGVDLVEIFGHLESGDQIAVRGADELRVGVKVNVKQALPAK